MMDREKVINLLSKYINCSFGDKDEKITVEEIITLLKAQEPVKPTWRLDYAYCGECGFHLHWMVEKNNYCPNCGRAVKWE